MTIRSIGTWELPQPTDLKEDDEWIKIPRIARTVPFGYIQDEQDPETLNPIKDELDKLEMARNYVKQYSYRQVANWLTTQTGRYISHVGLRKRLKNEQRRKNQARSLRKWAEYAEKAIAKAKEVEDIEELPIEQTHNVIFKPNEGPQTEFLAAGEREVLYGGSAGGGKSYAMLADPLRYMSHPSFSGLLLRHTTEELRELIFKSQELYPKIYPGIKWSERKMQWVAPSGARL